MNKRGTKNYWPMTEGVFNCLIDGERTEAFKWAIKNTIKRGDVVVDMGTGSGVLAMFAADAGAKKVFAIENDDNNLRELEKTFKISNYKNIFIINGDVTKIKLPEKANVIIGEMIATGLIEEQQIPAMNNILKFSKKDARILLNKYENYLDIVYNNDKYYGKKFPIIRYEYPDVKLTKSTPLSDRVKFFEVSFEKINKNKSLNEIVVIKITKSGIMNGIRVSSKTTFFDNSIFYHSFAYSFPVVLPVKERKVKIGEKYSIAIKYDLCSGFRTMKYFIKKLKK